MELRSTKGEDIDSSDNKNGREATTAVVMTLSKEELILRGIECRFSGSLTVFVPETLNILYREDD